MNGLRTTPPYRTTLVTDGPLTTLHSLTLPLWWPRTCCIYCGARITRPRHGSAPWARLTCERHASLVSRDPGCTWDTPADERREGST